MNIYLVDVGVAVLQPLKMDPIKFPTIEKMEILRPWPQNL